MGVFRIEKTGNYTVMSNYHFKDKSISLKAKGLLSQMLSLPDDWDYTLKGLASINKEGKDAIRSAIKELENAGYVYRRQRYDAKGQFSHNEYFVFEYPDKIQKHIIPPLSENPSSENPTTDNPQTENPTQLNTNKSITNKENTYLINHQPIKKEWWMDDYDECLAHLCDNIDLEYFPETKREVVTEIIGYMADAFCSTLPTQRINGEEISRNRVITRLMKVSEETIDTVIYDFRNLKEKIRNHRNYIITALYNAASSEHVDVESEFSRNHLSKEVKQ